VQGRNANRFAPEIDARRATSLKSSSAKPSGPTRKKLDENRARVGQAARAVHSCACLGSSDGRALGYAYLR